MHDNDQDLSSSDDAINAVPCQGIIFRRGNKHEQFHYLECIEKYIKMREKVWGLTSSDHIMKAIACQGRKTKLWSWCILKSDV
jgi:hypothetical protein